MKEIKGDIWKLAKNQIICITTNGMINSKGQAIMGKGIAKTAKERFKGIDKNLGEQLLNTGNHVYCMGIDIWNNSYYIIYTLPTKNDWKDFSSIELIKHSAQELVKAVDKEADNTLCYLPRPGCGNGGLKWEDVKPVLESILLDDRFIIVNIE